MQITIFNSILCVITDQSIINNSIARRSKFQEEWIWIIGWTSTLYTLAMEKRCWSKWQVIWWRFKGVLDWLKVIVHTISNGSKSLNGLKGVNHISCKGVQNTVSMLTPTHKMHLQLQTNNVTIPYLKGIPKLSPHSALCRLLGSSVSYLLLRHRALAAVILALDTTSKVFFICSFLS